MDDDHQKDDNHKKDDDLMMENSHLLDETRISQLFLDMARIDAPSFQERTIADAVIQDLASLDLAVEEDAAGQVI
ncbi:MAG: hypothetical protein H6Q62_496, partial [Firmicutes bacterium]|nr:hypothetical protein [Bacillota bacterium]